MPVYEYRCRKCGEVEGFVRTVENRPGEKVPCMICAGVMWRVISQIAVQSDSARCSSKWVESTTEFIKDGEEETLHFNPVKSRTEMLEICEKKGLIPAG